MARGQRWLVQSGQHRCRGGPFNVVPEDHDGDNGQSDIQAASTLSGSLCRTRQSDTDVHGQAQSLASVRDPRCHVAALRDDARISHLFGNSGK
jgi:hypothetical protein